MVSRAVAAERDSARAESDKMRAVYEAARVWREHLYQNDNNSDGCNGDLIAAIDSALTTPQPAAAVGEERGK